MQLNARTETVRLKDLKNYEATVARKVEGMSQSAISRISALNPYGGGNDNLWALHYLNNFDKHRLLFVVGAAHTRIGLDLDISKLFHEMFHGMSIPIQTLSLVPADFAWPLKDGTELFRIFKAARNSKLDDNPSFTFQIAFGDSEGMDGKPIIPPLHQTADLVDAIVLSFDDLLK